MLTRPEVWQPQGIDTLEPRAWEALRLADQSLSVTAGAGAGKTEFLAQKATYLLQTGICIPPKRILAISFKRDAARNLLERVAKRCPPERARRFDSVTFDGFTKNLLDRFRKAIPPPFCPPINYRIVFPSQTELRSFLESHGFHGISAGDLQSAITNTKLPLIDPIGNGQQSHALTQYWQSQYKRQEEAWLTFPMINRLVEWLLRSNESLRQALQLTYPFVFIDEFQDTTSAQFELIKTAFHGSHAVFTAVGDDKQRIMGWAGAMSNAFSRFNTDFNARTVSLLSNWRSHEDLVRIQHAIARRIDPNVEYPKARVKRNIDGDVAAIIEFSSIEEENHQLASWLAQDLKLQKIEPHDIAILVRMRADEVELNLREAFTRHGFKLRNVARNMGDISIQDILEESLTKILLPLLRLGATDRSPNDWDSCQRNMQFLEGIYPDNEPGQQKLQLRLQSFVRRLRLIMGQTSIDADSAQTVAKQVLDFVTISSLRQVFEEYQRQVDFDRAWNGFVALLRECVAGGNSWQEVLDQFEGRGQIALMTIHKSKGLEFHTMIFYGLDNQTWWSLTPNRIEELNSFFVAFTRAKQRAFFTLCTQRGQPVAWIENLLVSAGVNRINGTILLSDSPH